MWSFDTQQIVNILKNKLQAVKPSTDIGHHLKKVLIDQFTKRFENIEQVPLLVIATILDPRFKNINFTDKIACSRAINKITMLLNSKVTDLNLKHQNEQNEETNSNNNDKNFWSYHEKLVNSNIAKQIVNQDLNKMPEDFYYYLNQPSIKMDNSAIKYWSVAQDSHLKDLAIKYQSLIATSVSCERLFSKAGKIMTEERNRLKSDHLNQLLFLQFLELKDWYW